MRKWENEKRATNLVLGPREILIPVGFLQQTVPRFWGFRIYPIPEYLCGECSSNFIWFIQKYKNLVTTTVRRWGFPPWVQSQRFVSLEDLVLLVNHCLLHETDCRPGVVDQSTVDSFSGKISWRLAQRSCGSQQMVNFCFPQGWCYPRKMTNCYTVIFVLKLRLFIRKPMPNALYTMLLATAKFLEFPGGASLSERKWKRLEKCARLPS